MTVTCNTPLNGMEWNLEVEMMALSQAELLLYYSTFHGLFDQELHFDRCLNVTQCDTDLTIIPF